MKRGPALRGFTLLEIILTLVILGIVAVMGASFFSKGVTRTDVAIEQLQADGQLQLVLENMIQDASTRWPSDLSGLSASIGAVGSSSTTYGNTGNGSPVSYYVADKQFVCPNATTNSFAAANANQFLLVTIKANAASGVSLTYLFASSNPNANACGN
jgi:prepilin-type N-terminal cleavage/methylation domain-containing protein